MTTDVGCDNCGTPYGEECGFPDLVIPNWAWREISPNGDDTGLLCPTCICEFLAEKGITCEGAFMSGPVTSVSRPLMAALRRVENLEERGLDAAEVVRRVNEEVSS